MLKFLAQTIDNKVKHDFVFELENAIEYQNWRNNTMEIEYCSLEDLQNDTVYNIIDVDAINQYIPVGSIEFVFTFIDKYIKENGSNKIHPMNVPESLMKYAGCQIENIKLTDVNRPFIVQYLQTNYSSEVFIKSNDIIKFVGNGKIKATDLLYNNIYKNGSYQVKSIINDIISEYRCFIHNGELVGIQNYSGDFEVFPDHKKLKDIIEDVINICDMHTAYTVDIGITLNNDIIIIECHELFSCGFYGFADYIVIPYMLARTFNSLKNKINNE